MRCRLAILVALLLAVGAAIAQDSSKPVVARKPIQRVVPVYPELALRMNIFGTVKLSARVAPNGTVKAVEPVGGNPVLIMAAQDAVLKWKFAPAPEETRELIELRFSPR